MSERTAIEWCDSTFNPWTGCAKVSPGCDHCYAEAWAKRSGIVHWGPHAERRRTSASNWKAPLHWEKHHEAFHAQHGRRRRVFCASLADVFDNAVSTAWRRDLFEIIGATPNLEWLLLTKRIGNAREMLNAVVEELSHGINTWDERPWPGVWIGATVVDQAEADRDVPKLLQVPARGRFLSVEPMLGSIDLRMLHHDGITNIDALAGRHGVAMPMRGECERIDWVICGGESGPGARPMHPDWARSLRDQCTTTGVPFMFKQWGEWHPESSANYGTGPNTYRYGKVEGISMMPSGAVCVRNTADAPAGRPTVVDHEALQAWHDRCGRAEGKPDAENYPFGYQWLHRVGKKAAGRLLDGREHNDFPRGFA